MDRKHGLGKGLHSLMPQRAASGTPAAAAVAATELGPVTELPLSAIKPNPNQPRREFRDRQLLELAMSISSDGIIQPLIVRKVGTDYELIAGERRLRAAKLAGLDKVPVVVQKIADEKLLEIALIENIQREDLNPIELAAAFERMSSEMGLNHEEIGLRTGKDRATVTNAIRLLQLPADLQQLVSQGKLSPGHARALLKLSSEGAQREAARRAVEEGWTVRQIEERTNNPETTERKKREKPDAPAPDANVKAAIQEMERALGTRVRIFEGGKGKGKIEIEYYSAEDLDRIYTTIAK